MLTFLAANFLPLLGGLVAGLVVDAVGSIRQAGPGAVADRLAHLLDQAEPNTSATRPAVKRSGNRRGRGQ